MPCERETTAILSAADAIVAAREVCGDERHAALSALQDAELVPTADRLAAAFRMADAEWSEQQAGAGVARRIEPGERRRIESLLRTEGSDGQ